MRYCGFINRLLDLIWITETLFTTNHIMSLFKNKIENIQYKGAIQGTSREHLYHELVLGSLWDRRWCCKLTFFYKVLNGLDPKYLANYLNINDNQVYKRTASEHSNIKRLRTKTENFKQSFFLSLLMNSVN